MTVLKLLKRSSPLVLLALALLGLLLLTGGMQPTPAHAVSPNVVVSQVYGAGGNSGAVLKNDYVELFNRGTTTVSLNGWSIQYASASGTGNFASNAITPLSGSLAVGQYYLVQLAGGANGAALPTPDATGTVNMSGSGGKVALVNTTTGLACNGSTGQPCSADDLAKIIDLVGLDGSNFFEGAGAGPSISTITAAFRANGGCTDTDNNAADFAAAAPAPRNTASALHYCTGPTNPTATGSANPPAVYAGGTTVLTVNVTPGNYPPSTGLAVTGDLSSIGGSAAQAFTGNGNTFTFQATVAGSTAPGAKSLPVTVTDAQNRTGTASISLTVKPPLVAIHTVQGAAHLSPMTGQLVSMRGIVTAKTKTGFYMQDPNPDSDPATSEGILIYTSSAPTVAVGDLVEVSGTVKEYRASGSTSTNLTITEIDNPGRTVTVVSNGNPLPAPVILGSGGRVPPSTVIEDDATGDVETSGVFDPANDGIDFYESLEDMRVQINDAVAVGPTSFFGGSNPNREIPVVGENGANATIRTPRGGVIIRPGDYNPERIILNDLIAGGPTLPSANVGDKFPGAIVGVIDYSYGNYKLEVSQLPALVSGGIARQTATTAAGYQLAIGTFNVENLAPTDPPSKFSTLAGLIVNNLKSPDIIAIEEIQDNTGATNNGVVAADQTWGMLIAAIQAAGGPTYQYRQIDPVNNADGGATGGNIRQGFLFRTDRGLAFVDRPGGGSTAATTVLAGPQLSYSPGRLSPTDSAFVDSRKPLAGEFTFKGDKVFVIANHFNSKGGDQPLFGHFQPPVFSSETQRMQQATIVNAFANSILAADPNANIVVLGDLNDFQFSNPLVKLKGTILKDLIETLPENQRYSYVYEGNSETLDHILANNALVGRTFTYQVVHVNSEFADQASDHEPQVANLCVDRTAPTLTLTASPNVLWPADHKYTTVKTTVNATDNADAKPTWKLVSVVSNEPDEGLGDGDMPKDIVVVDNTTFQLRAERSGTGPGRIYTITYQAQDGCGNTKTATVTVTVPHDKGN